MFKKKKWALLPIVLLSTVTFAKEHVIVAPHCFIQNSGLHYKNLASTKNLSLITINEEEVPTLITKKHARNKSCGSFMDVTGAWQDNKMSARDFLQRYEITPHQTLQKKQYQIQYSKETNQLISQLNPYYIWDRVVHFANYPDRYANSNNGLKAATEIRNEMLELAKNTGHEDDVSVYFVPTGSFYKQPSVVMKFGNSEDAGIVIGAHIDTLSSTFSLKPGADDDASGSTTVLSTAYTLLSSGMHFKKPIYFVWYSAEELGLIGSQYVVADFKNKKIPVSDVIQFDMTGYSYHNEPTMWLMDDYVSTDLTSFIENLITTYVKVPVKHDRCGYACSDHATWNMNGFNSAMPFEASFGTDNPYIHTANDTVEKLSLVHMINFAKLGVAFATELAEPISNV
jgi:leucyl aminopeptidase